MLNKIAEVSGIHAFLGLVLVRLSHSFALVIPHSVQQEKLIKLM